MTAVDEKSRLRRIIRGQVAAISAPERAAAAEALAERFGRADFLLSSQTLVGYVALSDELGVSAALSGWLRRGGQLGLPVVQGPGLEIRSWPRGDPLVRGRLGTMEPTGPLLDLPEDGTGCVVMVPGRAFDHAGNRLGRGGGYYDRLLARLPKATTVGVGFDCQVVARVPAEPHDRRVGWLATDRRLQHVGSASSREV